MKKGKLFLCITVLIVLIVLLILQGFEIAYSKDISRKLDESTGLQYAVFYDNFVTITGAKENMSTINIPENIDGKAVIGIDACAFCDRSDIVTVNLPNTQNFSIDDSAFENCVNLENINLSDNIKLNGNSVFKNCDKLDSIE